MIGFSNLDQRHRFLIAGTAYSGLEVVTEDGNPAVLAVLDGEGNIIEAGEHVAETAWEAMVAIYKNFLQGNGHMLVKIAPPDNGSGNNKNIEKPTPKTKKKLSGKVSSDSKIATGLDFDEYKKHIQRIAAGDVMYDFRTPLKYDYPPSQDHFAFSHSFIANNEFTFSSGSYDDMAYDTNSRL